MLAHAEENSEEARHRDQRTQQVLRNKLAGLTSVLSLIDAQASCNAMTKLQNALDGQIKSAGEIKRSLYEIRDVLAQNFSPTTKSKAVPSDLDAAIRYYGARVDEIIASL